MKCLNLAESFFHNREARENPAFARNYKAKNPFYFNSKPLYLSWKRAIHGQVMAKTLNFQFTSEKLCSRKPVEQKSQGGHGDLPWRFNLNRAS